MKHFSRVFCASFILLSAFLFSVSSCKKSNGGDSHPDNLYQVKDGSVSATIGGNSWQANSVYAVDSANMIYIFAGSNNTTNSFPFIMMVFPDNLAQGASVSFDISKYTMLQYYENSSNMFMADAAIGGTGTITINTLNKSTKKASGSFTATMKSATAAAVSKTITGGQFNITYR
jgi:hypothetical protein